MKLAFHTNLWGGVFGHPAGVTSVKDLYYLSNDSTETAMRDIAAAGFRGFELFDGNLMQYANRQDELRGLMEELDLTMVAVYTGANFIYPDIFEEELFKIRGVAEFAAKFGTEHLVLGGGAIRSTGNTDDDYRRLAEGLDRAAALATEYGLTPSFHPHLGTSAQTPEQIARVFALSSIGFCPDTAHLDAAGGDSVELIKTYGSRIPYIHLKDYADGEFLPVGEGSLDFDAILTALAAHDYDGWITVELDAYSGPKQEIARKSREFLERSITRQVSSH
jgi:inosose dehydratase